MNDDKLDDGIVDVESSEDEGAKPLLDPTEVVARTRKMSTDIAEDALDIEDEELESSNTISEKTNLDHFLDEFNITRKQFFTFVTMFIVLLLLVILSIYALFKYFGNTQKDVHVIAPVEIVETEKKDSAWTKLKRLFSFEKSKDKTPPKKQNEKDDKKEESEDNKKPENILDENINGITSTTTLGKTPEIKLDSQAINLTKQIGFKSVQEDRLSYYVRLYRKVRNIFNTDLLAYLNQTVDRKKAFDIYLIQFKGGNEELKLANEDLLTEISDLKIRVDKLISDAKILENRFFDDLDNLNSEELPDKLAAFQEIANRRDTLKSSLKAREAVAAKYKKALPSIESRIKAIAANEDAFVKGVQIVDYKNVDLDLIIKE